MFWLILFALLFILAALGIAYLVKRFHRFSFIEKLSEKHKALSWILSVIPILAVISSAVLNPYTPIIIILHLAVFWLIADAAAFVIRKLTGRKRHLNIEGAFAVIFTAVYLVVGWQLAYNIRETDYTVYADKDIGTDSLRIVGIADSHLGITLDGDEFAEQIERIQAKNPDAVVISGDFVDDDSERKDMIRACEALGSLETKYGVYFVFGNHDKGYSEGSRDFDADDLRRELESNHVTVLEDETAVVSKNFAIVGRQDKSSEGRAEIGELMADVPPSAFTLVLDHQPNDCNAEAEAGADIVFSGHTHGGHIWPSGSVGLLIKANDFVYGRQSIGDTEFIVTSGISGWAIPFKTGAVSEFVVIDVKTNAGSE